WRPSGEGTRGVPNDVENRSRRASNVRRVPLTNLKHSPAGTRGGEESYGSGFSGGVGGTSDHRIRDVGGFLRACMTRSGRNRASTKPGINSARRFATAKNDPGSFSSKSFWASIRSESGTGGFGTAQ